jgi:hypothetical protein
MNHEMPVDRATANLNVKCRNLQPLDQVVFWFASSIKRTNAANSVASLSAQDLWCTSSNFDGALAGKFTGALVSSNSGAEERCRLN